MITQSEIEEAAAKYFDQKPAQNAFELGAIWAKRIILDKIIKEFNLDKK